MPGGLEDIRLYGPYPWAVRPSAAGRRGQVIQITDVSASSTGGSLFMSDGNSWMPLYPFIERSVTAVSVTGTTAETVLATFTLKGGLFVPGCRMAVSSLCGFVGTAGTKTARIRLGGAAGTIVFSNALAATTLSSNNPNVTLLALAAGSQAATASAATGAVVTAAVDMTIDQDVVLTMQLANAADSATLYYSLCQVNA
jgi:hypothetical protein